MNFGGIITNYDLMTDDKSHRFRTTPLLTFALKFANIRTAFLLPGSVCDITYSILLMNLDLLCQDNITPKAITNETKPKHNLQDLIQNMRRLYE